MISALLGGTRLLNIGVGQDLTPEAGDLMRVVDLHNVELLNDFTENAETSSLEGWNYFLAEENGDQVVHLGERVNFLVSLVNLVCHLASVVLVLEERFHGLAPLVEVVDIALGA